MLFRALILSLGYLCFHIYININTVSIRIYLIDILSQFATFKMFHDEFTISFTQDSVHDPNPHVPRPVSHDNADYMTEHWKLFPPATASFAFSVTATFSTSRFSFLNFFLFGIFFENRIFDQKTKPHSRYRIQIDELGGCEQIHQFVDDLFCQIYFAI